ncbi:MAG: hypothetical protein E6Q76_01210 [Rhizobium sp.]|nr:MAG: hypothetical protein E6Q76_01210 [Rhizobium sp.]
MENNALKHSQRSMMIPKGIWHLLAGDALQDDGNAIQIAAASMLNWPEFTSLSGDQIMLGEDGMFRLALWGASKCCATLLATRCATLLLSDGDSGWEIHCRVVANANLVTDQPLSGFLLKPVELFDRRTERRPQDLGRQANEIRRALFEAFPVGDDGENAPLKGGAPTQ